MAKNQATMFVDQGSELSKIADRYIDALERLADAKLKVELSEGLLLEAMLAAERLNFVQGDWRLQYDKTDPKERVKASRIRRKRVD